MRHHIIALLLAALPWGAQAQKYVGGDISLLDRYEAAGAKYSDTSGNAIASPLDYFREQGMNAMRVRLFVDPSKATADEKGQGVCQSLDYVAALGRRIKEAGMKLMLDFHYSDTWADPAKQFTPEAWLELDDSRLEARIYDYTREALAHMKAAGATPDFIQTGNEISYGMLWGHRDQSGQWKKFYAGNGSNAARFAALLKSAVRACREECPAAQVVIHTERVADAGYLRQFYADMAALGVDYDIIGLSYYPYFHGSLSRLDAALTTMESSFAAKKIMIVEAGYYHAWQPADVSYDLSAKYPVSNEGQKKFADDLVALLNSHANVSGLFWWWMEANECGLDWNTSRVTDNWYNAGLFDNQTGRAMDAITSLKAFLTEQAGIGDVAADPAADSRTYSVDGKLLPADAAHRRGVIVRDGRKIIVR